MSRCKHSTQKDYSLAVSFASQQGVNFNSTFFAQPRQIGSIMRELADQFGYRAPKNRNGSTGRYFFELLKRRYGNRSN